VKLKNFQATNPKQTPRNTCYDCDNDYDFLKMNWKLTFGLSSTCSTFWNNKRENRQLSKWKHSVVDIFRLNIVQFSELQGLYDHDYDYYTLI
jgi:hypothetical protein